MTIALLAICGVLESVVYLHRYRSANRPGALASAASTFAVCLLRVGFTMLGVSAVMHAHAWWSVMVAYAVPATLATWAAHAWIDSNEATQEGGAA